MRQIRDAAAREKALVSSLYTESVIRSRASSSGGVSARLVHVRAAALGSSRFADVTHEDKDFAAELDPNHNITYVHQGKMALFWPLTGICKTSRREANLASARPRGQFVLESIGWWLREEQSSARQQGPAWSLQDVLARSTCRLLPAGQLVDGARCHVVELPGVCRLWLDPSIGFAPRRWERYTGTPPVPLARCELSSYHEVVPGVWLPSRLHRVLFDVERSTVQKTAVAADVFCVIERIEVNRLPKGFFDFVPPPGALIHDLDADTVKQVPGGLPFLDRVIEVAAKRAAIYAASRMSTDEPETLVLARGAPVAAMLVLGALNIYLWRKALRSPRLRSGS
ncbi:MAG TPA: hypothetical protein VFA18_01930 [Gemmataceae bacterium]|nr:hypothetical protein [Gemmataceae bacterium]